MTTQMIERIYCDMDGVVADWYGRWEALFGEPCKKSYQAGKFDEYFEFFIAQKQFETLDLLPGAQLLIDHLKLIEHHQFIPIGILSSTSTPERHEPVVAQKKIWLQEYNFPRYWKTILVPGSDLKQQYAQQNHVLIDDLETNINDWEAAGGIGILHTSAKETIAQLNNLLV